MAGRRRFVTRAEYAKAPSPLVMLRKAYNSEVEPVPESRILRFTISTEGIDRDNDIISATGWDTKNYEKNPVVLWAHQYDQLPVGKAKGLKFQGGKIVADVEFVPAEVYPFAETVYRMVKAGFLSGTSVGFRPVQSSFNEKRQGYDFSKQELLEFSVVPIPANPDALLEARAAGVIDETDVAAIQEWATKSLTAIAESKPVAVASLEALPADAAWEAPTLKAFTVRAWDKLGPADRRKVAGHFAYGVKNPPDTFEELAFPHHDPATGKVSWAGLVTAMGDVLAGAKGLDIAPDHLKAIYDHLADHFKAFGRTAPEPKALEKSSDIWYALLPAEKVKELPTPNDQESESDFVSRCMGSGTMGDEFGDEKQRAAVCYSQYRHAKALKPVKQMDGCPRGEDCPMKPGMEYCPAGDECPMGKGQKAAESLIEKVTKLEQMLADIRAALPKAKAPPVVKEPVLPDPASPTFFLLDDETPPPADVTKDAEIDIEGLDDAGLKHSIATSIQKAVQKVKTATTGELD